MDYTYQILLFVHVLLFVFWIGTDVGVFVLGKIGQSPRYSERRRAESFETALVLDRLPRICFSLMLPVGMTLAQLGGVIQVADVVLTAVWLLGLLWLACVLTGMMFIGGALFKTMRFIDRLIQVAVCIGTLWFGLPSVLGIGPIDAPWFAWKLVAFGLLAGAALALDFASQPTPGMFAELEANGSSPALEARINGTMNRIYVFVAMIYIFALVAAFCGVTKLPA